MNYFRSPFKSLNKILCLLRRTTHGDEVAGGGQLLIIAMPLDPAFGFAMVGVFIQDCCCHEYYSYAENVREAVI
jgi:hypothetical protein